MLFVSRYRAFQAVVQSQEVDYRVMPNGKVHPVETLPEVVATFNEDGYLTPRERLAAWNQLRAMGEGALPAMPLTVSGVLSSEEGGTPFSQSDPSYRVSTFRTDSVEDPERRKLFEERLMQRECGFGTDYVLVESGGVPKPWPKYDDVDAKTAHTVIPARVRDLGLDPAVVLEYEMASANRPAVVEALNALVAKAAEDAFEQRPLEVTL